MLNLFDMGYDRSRPAITFENKTYSYEQLCDKILEFETEFKDKITAGQVVLLNGDYNLLSVAALLALKSLKATIVPNVSIIKEEVEQKTAICQPDFIFTIEDDALKIEKIIKNSTINANDFAKLVLFSSGSTGKPKGMVHNFDNLVQSYEDKKDKNLIFLVFLMFDHIGGLNTLFNALAMKAHLVFTNNRDVDIVAKLIEKHKINILPASPTFLNLLLMNSSHTRYNLSSLRLITYGTEMMPEQLLLRIKQAFPRVKLLQTFGTSETGIVQTTSFSSNSTFIKIDDQQTEYKVINAELWIKSKTQIIGYLNAEMDSFEDGWFKTGDIVEQGEEGFIRIIGRIKEVINVGGLKVLPSEIETITLELPFVHDCLAYGEKNAITGQSVALNVTIDKAMSEVEARKNIRNHFKNKLDRFKTPNRINFVESNGHTDRYKKIRHINQ